MPGPQADRNEKVLADRAFEKKLERAQESGRLGVLESVRNELDAGVSKLPRLTPHERSMLAVTAALPVGFCVVGVERPLLNPTSPGFDEGLKKRLNPLQDSLCTLSEVLSASYFPGEDKHYEALVQKVWKSAKSQLDAILETPESKSLLKEFKNLPTAK